LGAHTDAPTRPHPLMWTQQPRGGMIAAPAAPRSTAPHRGGPMPAPSLYLHLPGTAAEALEFYQGVFGGTTSAAPYAELVRPDEPADAIAHGERRGAVDLYVSDAGAQDEPCSASGLLVALLGVAERTTLRAWFAGLAEAG